MAGRPPGSQNKDKPLRDAIRMEAALLANTPEDEVLPAVRKGSLRSIARNLLLRADDDTPAAIEVGNRLDGKPAQAIIGGDEDDPAIQTITKIELVGVRPADQDS